MWSWVKIDAERHCGIKFTLQMMRRSFGQIAKDRGVNIEAVSRALRHSSTKTTETYYARIRPDNAFRELEAAFADYDAPQNGPVPKALD